MSQKAKKILIIGATGGIGSSISKSLSNNETHLILHGTQEEKLRVLADEIIFMGTSVTFYTGDLTTKDSTRIFCNKLVDYNGSFDWIIYSAGYIDETEPQGLISANSAASTFNINVLAAEAIIQKCETLISGKGGVIFISSTAGLWGNGEYPVYAASKAALNNLGKSLAKRWGKSKKAITICPGPTNTAMRNKIAHDAETHQSPNDIGKLVSTIISDTEAYPSGSIIQVRDSKVSVIPDA